MSDFFKKKLLLTVQRLMLMLTFFSCGKRESSNTDTQQAESVSKPQSGPAGVQLALAARLTPEQVSRILKDRLNFEVGWTDKKGVFHDAILENFAVSLGGVDFENTFERDPLPKVQTILVSRALAWTISGALIWWETDPEKAKKTDRQRVLNIAELKTDFPAEAVGSFPFAKDLAPRDQRWRAQLVSIYEKLLARPPNTAEIDACAKAFASIMKNQPWPPVGWQLIIYSLLSSAEFWNLWGSQ